MRRIERMGADQSQSITRLDPLNPRHPRSIWWRLQVQP